jgi:hypothetical protein
MTAMELATWRDDQIAEIAREVKRDGASARRMLAALGAVVNNPGTLAGHEQFVKDTYTTAARIVRLHPFCGVGGD